jgi:hypothetical protein
MMPLAIAGLAVLASAPLVAWRWYLTERRFALLHERQENDAALASFEPRIRALEEQVKGLSWTKAMR